MRTHIISIIKDNHLFTNREVGDCPPVSLVFPGSTRIPAATMFACRGISQSYLERHDVRQPLQIEC